MHLGDADALGDLALAELLVEPQADDLLLPLGQRRQQVLDERRCRRRGRSPRPRRRSGGCRRRRRRPARRGWPSCRPSRRRCPRRPRRCSMPRCSASCGTVGERPSRWVSSSVARRSRRWVSLAERGTRTVHVWSRKWRLISPSIVRPANVEKATLRSGSKRSTALTRARKATWRRSSSLGPRRPKRRATWAARPMCRSTRSLRRRRLPVRRNSRNSASSSSRWSRRSRCGAGAGPASAAHAARTPWSARTTSRRSRGGRRRPRGSAPSARRRSTRRRPRRRASPRTVMLRRRRRRTRARPGRSGRRPRRARDTSSLTPRRRSSRSSTLSPLSAPSDAATTRAAARNRGDAGRLRRTGPASDSGGRWVGRSADTPAVWPVAATGPVSRCRAA